MNASLKLCASPISHWRWTPDAKLTVWWQLADSEIAQARSRFVDRCLPLHLHKPHQGSWSTAERLQIWTSPIPYTAPPLWPSTYRTAIQQFQASTDYLQHSLTACVTHHLWGWNVSYLALILQVDRRKINEEMDSTCPPRARSDWHCLHCLLLVVWAKSIALRSHCSVAWALAE